MFLPESYQMALLLMFVGMVCWGSWANPYKLTSNWRFELFYVDYSFGIFFTCLAAALTLGTWFAGKTAIEDLIGAGWPALLYALLAGVVLNCGNVLLTAAMALVGMATAFPVSIGISFVAGTALSYFVMPRGNPVPLFGGVAAVLAAVIVNAAAYRTTAQRKPQKGGGLGLCVLAGLLLAGFGPLVAKSISGERPLAPYGAAVLFTLGALLSTFPLLRYVTPRFLKSAPVSCVEYRSGTLAHHAAGWSAGAIWATGTVAAFIAANVAGMALSGAIGQANPLIAALWGVFVWREFDGAKPRTKVLLGLMFALYAVGLVLLALSFSR